MALKKISPVQARELLNQGAVLVDIRSADEHARERVAGATHIPLEQLNGEALSALQANAVIFHCRSGTRTAMHAHTLETCAPCDAYMLDGGLDAWKKAGLPVEQDASRPIELSRQVQIAAGSLVLTGVALGLWVSPAFYALSAFIGAGLVFAGITGFCGLARILMKMPWNTRHTQA